MNLLLDTHAVLWLFAGDNRLPLTARGPIDDSGNSIFISSVSVYEISLKSALGKLPYQSELAAIMANIESFVLEQLPVTLVHAHAAGQLSLQHRDPFDRLIAAQALIESMSVVTNDSAFRSFGVATVW